MSAENKISLKHSSETSITSNDVETCKQLNKMNKLKNKEGLILMFFKAKTSQC